MSNDAPTIPFPLPDDIVALAVALLCDCEIGEFTSLDEAVAATQDEHLADGTDRTAEEHLVDVLGPTDGWIAVAPMGSDWSLLVADGATSGGGIGTTGSLIVVNQSAEQRRCTWDDLRNDPAYWLRPGARLIGTAWEDGSEYPFAFDAESWEGTRCDLVYGDTEWVVRQGTDDYSFDLNYVDLRYRVPADELQGGAGVLLAIEEGGSSMTTGEIGCTVSVDSNGSLWYYAWGCLEIFVGRQSKRLAATDAQAMVQDYLDGAELYSESVVGLESELRSAAEMWAVIAGIYGDDPTDDDLAEVEVSCLDFSGTASELRAMLTGATDPDD